LKPIWGEKKNRQMWFDAKNLKVHYSKVEALKSVSLGLDEGMIVTLIGSNGAGKSTTLRAISGLVRMTSGKIWFQGKRIDIMSPYKIARLGIAHVPEGKRLFVSMSVIDNLLMGAYLIKSGTEVAKVLEGIYKHFPILKERHLQLAGSLSGGEQQMLATARALMGAPKLLLMDEPSLGLSPVLVQEVASMIKDINRDGVSIILVEQNARMALRLSQRAYVLEVGQVVFEGDAKELANDEHVKKAYLGG
jgi:branched-chain amino acid transport system ATP-binding protein